MGRILNAGDAALVYDRNAKMSYDGLTIPANVTTATYTFAAADAVLFAPFLVARQFTAKRMAVMNGTTPAGNVQMGIYGPGGQLLASTPAVAQSGSSVIQMLDLTSLLTLGPGLYFLALSPSSTSAQFTAVRTAAGGTLDANLLGFRVAASGGIVEAPVIEDLTTAVVPFGNIPLFGALGFAAAELVAP